MKNAKCDVSVVIPVFNEEKNLEELIKRCMHACDRLGKPFEIILVDDGSGDRSADMISAAARQHAGRIIAVLLNRELRSACRSNGWIGRIKRGCRCNA